MVHKNYTIPSRRSRSARIALPRFVSLLRCHCFGMAEPSHARRSAASGRSEQQKRRGAKRFGSAKRSAPCLALLRERSKRRRRQAKRQLQAVGLEPTPSLGRKAFEAFASTIPPCLHVRDSLPRCRRQSASSSSRSRRTVLFVSEYKGTCTQTHHKI
jgi:hypothetical protein